MTILSAVAADADELSIITKRSKAHWGYGAAQMEAWDEELTLSADYIEENRVYKLLTNDLIVAYYALLLPPEGPIYLDNLFVLPAHMGKGLGRILLEHALEVSKSLGFQSIKLDADPHATTFYLKYGFKIIDQKPTAIPNRFLPVMIKSLQ